MNSPFGIAFLGGGMVAELHARAIDSLSDARLIGLFDPDEARSEERSREWGCRAYSRIEDLLADDAVEGVLVLAPFEAHEELALRCLDSGKHVLVEKPVASREGIRRLIDVARRRQLTCMPGHNYAYQREFGQLRRLVVERAFGDVRAAWVTYVIRHPEEVAAAYSGVLAEVMIHHAYLALALFGTPDRVYAGKGFGWDRLIQDDQAWMTWEYDPNLSVHLFATFAVDDDTSDPWTFVVKVLGTRGGGTYSWRSLLYNRPLGSLARALPAYEDSYIDQDAAFVAAARGDTTAILSPLEHALCSAELISAAGAASEARAAVATRWLAQESGSNVV
jgi:predicted dehydrogenase